MRIALTGATGFIGQRLCSRLLEAGHELRLLARDPDKVRLEPGAAAETVKGALDSDTALDALVDAVDAVIHLAGAVRGATAADFDAANVDGTARLLAALQRKRADTPLLFCSSLAAREPGLSHYAASKRQAEELLRQRSGLTPVTILRPPAVYGPGDREMLPVFRFMARTGMAPCPGASGARLSLIFVEDLVSAMQAWLECGMQRNATYELHDGQQGGYDWTMLADIVAAACQRRVRVWQIPAAPMNALARLNGTLARLLGYSAMLTPGKLRELRHPDWVCDNQAISRDLNWTPRTALARGLELTPGWRD
jgi:2-alkyl-3-oxoalkanoate reductase